MKTIYKHVAYTLKNKTTSESTTLDIGCGDQRYKKFVKGNYFGIDLEDSPYIEDKPCFLGDFNTTEIPSNHFNLVYGVGVFCLLPDIENSFRKCHQILKEGGEILVFDYPKSVLKKLGEKGYENYWDFDNLSSLLRSAGFKDVKNISHLSQDENLQVTNSIDFSSLDWLKLLMRKLYTNFSRTEWLLVSAKK